MSNVVVVDDNAATRECIRLVLEDAGHAVLEAPNGQVAYALLRQTSESFVVLFDKHMPELDGAGFLALVAQDERMRARHAYICVTASPSKIAPELCALLSQCAAPIVGKPFDVDDLLQVVAGAAERLASTQALLTRGTLASSAATTS